MKILPKFSGPNLDSREEFAFQNLWQREEYPEWSRLRLGAAAGEIPLILDLCRGGSSFGLLYVLLASRCGQVSGRYQSPEPVDYNGLELFLYTFQEFFEQDGRHNLWILSLDDQGQFVFDQHNIVYAYGDLDRYQRVVESNGFSEGKVRVPAPHAHHYHQEFDAQEGEVMEYFEWIHFPLEPGDDD